MTYNVCQVWGRTLSSTPLPTLYVTVNVVFDGATPYVLAYIKFDGSIPWSADLLMNIVQTNVIGICNSSSAFEKYRTKLNINLTIIVTRVMYRFGTRFNFNKDDFV